MPRLRTTLLLALLALLLAPAAHAQFTAQKVDAAEVPDNVTASLNAVYPGAKAVVWTRYTLRDAEEYAAGLTYNGIRYRARWKPDGTQVYERQAYGARKIPADIARQAQAEHPSYQLRWAHRITYPRKNFVFWKVRLGTRGATATVYIKDGGLIPESALPDEESQFADEDDN